MYALQNDAATFADHIVIATVVISVSRPQMATLGINQKVISQQCPRGTDLTMDHIPTKHKKERRNCNGEPRRNERTSKPGLHKISIAGTKRGRIE